MSRKQSSVLAVGLAAVLTALAGCASSQASGKPKHTWEVRIDAVGDIAVTSVEIHLIGVEQDEIATWNNLSMTRYWHSGPESHEGRLRDAAVAEHRVKVVRFGPGKEASQVYMDGSKDSNDPWNRWVARADGRPLFLVVLADLPGQFDDVPQEKDPRRLTLPLDKKRWEGKPRIIHIEVQNWGVRAATKPKPERAKKRFLLF